MIEPDPENYDVTNYETWSTEALQNHAAWLYEQDAAGEGDYYDDLGKIAAILNERGRAQQHQQPDQQRGDERDQ